MGPKRKGDNKKYSPPKVDVEKVTELQRQIFEIQLDDINKKISRLISKQEEWKLMTEELIEKVEECKKENGAIISEKEQMLLEKETQKIQMREEAVRLSKEIKNSIERHKAHIEEMKKAQEDKVTEMTNEIEVLSEQARILEQFKANKESYEKVLTDMEKRLADAEVEHKRILFNINQKEVIATARLKRELEARLLNLSLELQQIYQKQVGDSCHRMTLENKAIESELKQMEEEVEEYKHKQELAVRNLQIYKIHNKAIQLELDKALARVIVQNGVIGALKVDKQNVQMQLAQFTGLEIDHKNFIKRLRGVEVEINKVISKMMEITKVIELKKESILILKEDFEYLKKIKKKLQMLIRNALKLVEEIAAVHLIPLGELEEEKLLTLDAKIRLFKKRKESVFRRKGRMLQYVFEVLGKAQLTEEETNKLKSKSKDTISMSKIDFTVIFAKGGEKEPEEEKKPAVVEAKKGFGLYNMFSDSSLPRSISEIFDKEEEEEFGSDESEHEEVYSELEEGKGSVAMIKEEGEEENIEEEVFVPEDEQSYSSGSNV